jgi:hypothetical protein
MPTATIADAIPLKLVWTDPETGLKWLHVDVPAPGDWSQVCALPAALSYEGEVYVRTGWNSDKLEAYYRNKMPYATPTKEK